MPVRSGVVGGCEVAGLKVWDAPICDGCNEEGGFEVGGEHGVGMDAAGVDFGDVDFADVDVGVGGVGYARAWRGREKVDRARASVGSCRRQWRARRQRGEILGQVSRERRRVRSLQ